MLTILTFTILALVIPIVILIKNQDIAQRESRCQNLEECQNKLKAVETKLKVSQENERKATEKVKDLEERVNTGEAFKYNVEKNLQGLYEQLNQKEVRRMKGIEEENEELTMDRDLKKTQLEKMEEEKEDLKRQLSALKSTIAGLELNLEKEKAEKTLVKQELDREREHVSTVRLFLSSLTADIDILTNQNQLLKSNQDELMVHITSVFKSQSTKLASQDSSLQKVKQQIQEFLGGPPKGSGSGDDGGDGGSDDGSGCSNTGVDGSTGWIDGSDDNGTEPSESSRTSLLAAQQEEREEEENQGEDNESTDPQQNGEQDGDVQQAFGAKIGDQSSNDWQLSMNFPLNPNIPRP